MHTSSPSLQSSLNQPTFQIKIAKKNCPSLSFFSTFFPTFSLLSEAYPFLLPPSYIHPNPMSPFLFSSFLLSLSKGCTYSTKHIYIFTHLSRATLSSTFQQHHWFFSSLWYLCLTFLCFKPSGKAELDYWRASTIKGQEEEEEEEEAEESIWDGTKGLYLSPISPIGSFPLFR